MLSKLHRWLQLGRQQLPVLTVTNRFKQWGAWTPSDDMVAVPVAIDGTVLKDGSSVLPPVGDQARRTGQTPSAGDCAHRGTRDTAP